MTLIENLGGFAVISAPVNSGVRLLSFSKGDKNMHMKLSVAAFAIAILMVSSYMITKPTQSSFFSSFSLRELVQKNESRSGLNCSVGGIGGGGGAGGIGSKEFHNHKGESFSCRIKSNNGEQFNEAEFITSLKENVEKIIQASGAKVTDGGNLDPSGFYFEYSIENIQGRVDVSGKKIREDYYSLKADLNEKGKKDPE